MSRWAKETLHLWRSIPVMLALALLPGTMLWSLPVGAPPGTTAYLPLVPIGAEADMRSPTAMPTRTVAPTRTPGVYYVAPSGNDSDAGTQSQPWRTIQKAANAMVAGDSTTVLSGNYNERVQVTISGTVGAPITYQAEGTVTMKGFSVRADYITIKGFEISNTDGNLSTKDGVGIFVEGSNCLIEGNYIHYASWGGILIWAEYGNEITTNHCIVRNNRLYRNALFGVEVFGRDNLIEGNEIWGTIQHHPNWSSPPPSPDADGIHFFGAGHTIRKNYIHDISYRDPENVDPHIDCFQTWDDPGYVSAGHDIILEQNYCKNLEAKDAYAFGKAFMLNGASNLVIKNNVLQTYAGIVAAHGGNLTIVNNTITSDLSLYSRYGQLGVDLTQTSNVIVKNNIFYDFPTYGIYIGDGPSQQGLDFGYNLFYRSDGRVPSSSPYPHDLMDVNPMFVNPTSGDFHLQPNSPAVDAGNTLAVVTDDFSGNARPQGTRYDIGAYETLLSRKTVWPADAHLNDVITFTITVAVNGNPATATDVLPVQLGYVSSSTDCPGSVIYDANAGQVTYSGTPQADLICSIQISARVATSQRMAVINTATIDNSPTPPQNLSVTVILNGLRLHLPLVRR